MHYNTNYNLDKFIVNSPGQSWGCTRLYFFKHELTFSCCGTHLCGMIPNGKNLKLLGHDLNFKFGSLVRSNSLFCQFSIDEELCLSLSSIIHFTINVNILVCF